MSSWPTCIRQPISRSSTGSETPLCHIADRGKADSRKARAAAEAYIGRPLEKGEVVHHMNGDASDNRPENLLVMPDRQHRQLHMALAMEQMEGGETDGK